MTGADWRAENAGWLAGSLDRLRLRLNRRALWLNRALADGRRAADWLVALDDADAARRFHDADPATKAIDEMIAVVSTGLAEDERRMRESSRPPALHTLTQLTELSDLEENLILLAAAPSLDGAFSQAYAELHGDPRLDYATLHLGLGAFTEGAPARLLAADCLMPSRPLRALQLLEIANEEAHDGGGPLLTRRLAVDERLVDYLRGLNRPDVRVTPFLTEAGAPLHCGTLERVGAEVAEVVAADESWTTVNLVGTAEGGARDVAVHTGAGLSLRVAVIDVARLTTQPPSARSRLIALLGREALLGGFALLADTAAIERESPEAAVVDELIEQVLATLFVVSERPWPGGNTAHRDTHVVSVARPTRSEQGALWRMALQAHPNSVNGEVEAIVQQFDFGPPTIAATVARAGQGGGVIGGRELWNSCRAQSGTALDDLAKRVTPGYGWDDIVLPADAAAQLRALANQVEQRGQVYETWGFAEMLGRGRGITALFAGASGTGKTMAAEILAAQLELDLYRIDLAGIVSKYVGETEKNLRRVFDAAESSGAILFFDEADALFGTRTEVRDSHDRYANFEVNYLLQRMEDYAGLAILATNRRSALDPAFLRRLRFVIDFPFPSPEDRRRIWAGVFPARAALDGVEYSFLSRLELSGGNIRSIAVNAAFLAAAEQASIGMPHLVRAAAREYTKLSKPISATDFGDYFTVAKP